MKFNIGDWVQGKSKEGELIHGFIDTIDILQGIVTVYVVNSDNEETIGKVVAVREHWLRSSTDIKLDNAQVVHNLIDMALATWDEEWFMELTDSLKSIEGSSNEKGSGTVSYPFHHNRLGPVGR
ncbi:hypothetical protein [Paenibacillus harenae]|uniref:hypothetical protein n=1 Tax=Paenibacillus harenae TaxID=306543 RepID=UPI0004179C10|nr:hypothetical protein [Paenibacillus harenae]